jgi:hypothetical protein
VIDQTGGARLLFGTASATGTVDELFWVDAKGDLFAKGALHGTRTEGQVAIESGVISHGLPLPLPAGVTPDEVTSGSVVLHVTLSPMYPPEASPPTNAAYSVIELREVAGRVVSRYARFDPTVTPPTVVEGICRYQIIAAVPPAGVTP